MSGRRSSKIGRNGRVDVRRLGSQFARGQMEIRRRLAHQHCDRIFKLFPLLLQQRRLGPRCVQQRFFLRHV